LGLVPLDILEKFLDVLGDGQICVLCWVVGARDLLVILSVFIILGPGLLGVGDGSRLSSLG